MEPTTHHINSAHILALALILLFSLGPFARADIGIGAIVIDSKIEGKGDFETNAGINVGDIITTGDKGNVTILFDDESMLTLGPNSKAQIVTFSETPAPGMSEIKIISGSFRYFPGIILENGGQQVLNNVGGTSNKQTGTSAGPDVALNSDQPLNNDLNNLNEQLNDIQALNFVDAIAGSIIETGTTGTSQPGGPGATPPAPPPP